MQDKLDLLLDELHCLDMSDELLKQLTALAQEVWNEGYEAGLDKTATP